MNETKKLEAVEIDKDKNIFCIFYVLIIRYVRRHRKALAKSFFLSDSKQTTVEVDHIIQSSCSAVRTESLCYRNTDERGIFIIAEEVAFVEIFMNRMKTAIDFLNLGLKGKFMDGIEFFSPDCKTHNPTLLEILKA